MFQSNAPKDYVCPICLGVQGVVNDQTLMRPSDVVFQDDKVTVFINSFFMGKNAGHVIIVPNKHFENLYTIPKSYLYRIIEVAQRMAIAMKHAYKTDGITTRQNNEPAGDQHAFHFHFHVFPRYKDDRFNTVTPEQKRLASTEERTEYAQKLKAALR
ncbi:MAG: HIT family protein [Candidatus Saccharimonadales bacterium]